MKKLRQFYVLGFLSVSFMVEIFFSNCVFANNSATDSSTSAIDIRDAFSKRLDFIFKDDKLSKTQLGIQVYSLSRQESLYSKNAEAPLAPASAIKLLTALVALKKLGPDFTYKTEVFLDGTQSQSTLKGNIYIKGSGDPSLVTERLFLLANDIARTGIKNIQGNIVVDDWTFDQVKIDPKRIPTDTDRAYNAPVGGVSFNYNTTTVFFRPGEKVGDKPHIFIEPDTGYVRIVNQAKTSARGGAYALVASRVKGDGENTIIVKGSIPIGMGEQRSYFNITDPHEYTGYALKYLLSNRGINVSSKEILHSPIPKTARKIAELESLPLREIVTLMNKFSNNFIADTLVKTLGRELKGSPGTMDKGLQVLMEEATRMGMNTAGFKIVSGSGLTRENKVTAAQFTALMNAAYLDFDVLPELLSSLPIAGKDGTLRRRMKGTSAYGKLRGKTGSIDGVSALVGLVQSRGGELLTFSVLMNDKSKFPGALHPWQNYLAQALADFNRKSPLTEKPSQIPMDDGTSSEESFDAP